LKKYYSKAWAVQLAPMVESLIRVVNRNSHWRVVRSLTCDFFQFEEIRNRGDLRERGEPGERNTVRIEFLMARGMPERAGQYSKYGVLTFALADWHLF
jgi:hypothetical protein